MPTAPPRRGARAAVVAVLALATGLAGAGTVDGAIQRGHERAPTEVRIGPAGIEAPDTAIAGTVTFHVSTDDPKGRFVQLFRPNTGVSVEKVLADFGRAVSHIPGPSAAGISAVNGEAELFGGASVTPGVAETLTTPITPGTLYLLDFTSFLQHPDAPVLRSIELCDGPVEDLARFPSGIVIQHETDEGPRFQAENLTEADGTYVVHNSSDEIHEMMLQPVPMGTTDEQLQAGFNAILAGAAPLVLPPAHGLGAISPNHTVVLHAEHLPAGTYALLCFVPDGTSGLQHAFLGMHKVVDLH